jgi:hypothetical protein
MASNTPPPAVISKRSVQRKVLGRILQNFRNRQDGKLTVLCLPGQSGWDLRYFQSREEVGHIVAIERNPEIAADLRCRFPDVEVFEGESSTYLASTDTKFHLLYLDYCSNFHAGVEWDIRTVFRRQILHETGKVICNLLGARDSLLDQERHRALYEDFVLANPWPERWEDISMERRRLVAMNALIGGYRTYPLRPWRRGDPRRVYATTSSVSWLRYKTNSNYMYTGWFTLNRYTNKADRGAVRLAPHRWFVTGEVKTVEVSHLAAVARLDGVDSARRWYINAMWDFYRKHHYTPTTKEIGKGCIKDWRVIVRAAGLCPRQHATREEIIAEIQRIYAREGFVTWDLVAKAQIARRPLFAKGRKAMADLLTGLGIPHELGRAKGRPIRRRMSRLKAWVLHLESGAERCQFKGYKWAIKSGYKRYEDAVRDLRVFEAKVSLGVYEDVEPWPYFSDLPLDQAEEIALRAGAHNTAARR